MVDALFLKNAKGMTNKMPNHQAHQRKNERESESETETEPYTFAIVWR